MLTAKTFLMLTMAMSGHQFYSSMPFAKSTNHCSVSSREFADLRSMAVRSIQNGNVDIAYGQLQGAYAIYPNDYENGLDLVKVQLARE